MKFLLSGYDPWSRTTDRADLPKSDNYLFSTPAQRRDEANGPTIYTNH